MTKLGDLKKSGGISSKALGDAAPIPADPGRLHGIRLARGEDAVLPILGPVWIQLLGHRQENEVEAGVLREMEQHKIPITNVWAWTVELERKARTLALAIRERDDHDKPVGTLEEWCDLDDRVIMACDLHYAATRDRLDPLASTFTVREDRAAEIFAAFKKKERMSLLSFGIDELVSWLLSGAVQPSICPTPSSGSTDASPGRSETSSASSPVPDPDPPPPTARP